MPYKDTDKERERQKIYRRKKQGYLTGDRPTLFACRFPQWQKQILQLEERQQVIIKQYYGLEGEPQTLKAIASLFGVTAEAIRQERDKAEKKLSLCGLGEAVRSWGSPK